MMTLFPFSQHISPYPYNIVVSNKRGGSPLYAASFRALSISLYNRVSTYGVGGGHNDYCLSCYLEGL